MLKLNALFIIILLFSFPCNSSALEKRYMEIMVATAQSFEREGGDSIWPRFQPFSQPVVFHFNNGHVYAFGLNSRSPFWEKLAINQFPILFCRQYPKTLAPLHPSFPIENQRAFVFSMDHADDSSVLPLLTFIHERFHIHQFINFAKEKIAEGLDSDDQSIEQLALMELENLLLANYLKAEGTRDKKHLLKDYLAVSESRRNTLHPAALNWEDHQQKMEGLADYVSVKTFESFPIFQHFDAAQALLEMRNKKITGSVRQDALKDRHYFIGAVLALALDECQIPYWKMRIENEKISLQSLLKPALFMDQFEIDARTANVKSQYDWIAIQKSLSAALNLEKREGELVLAEFEKQEGVLVRMGLPRGRMSAGGTHEKSCPVGQGRKVMLKDASVARSLDESWKLTFNEIPILLENQKGARSFKLDPGVILDMDGKKLSIKDLLNNHREAEISFSAVSFQADDCSLESKRPGKIMIQNNALTFIFDPK